MQSFMFTRTGWELITPDLISACEHAGVFHKKQTRAAYNRAYMREWRKAHPMSAEQRRKDNCRSYAHVYLKRGKLTRQPCRVCGSPAEMHHPDYSQPLNVVWVCRRHHLAIHKMDLV